MLPLFLSDTHEYRFAFVATFFIAALGLQILTGYAGLISLGQSGFMLIGAYTTTILSVDHGWNDLATIPLAGLLAGIAGFLFGFPALRLRGAYLALATFAIPIALIALAKKYSDFTGGGGGKNLTRVLTGHEAYVMTWPIAGVMFVLAWLLLLGKLGRSFRTIRESEIAAVSSGVNLTVTKTLAFGISAFFAGDRRLALRDRHRLRQPRHVLDQPFAPAPDRRRRRRARLARRRRLRGACSSSTCPSTRRTS